MAGDGEAVNRCEVCGMGPAYEDHHGNVVCLLCYLIGMRPASKATPDALDEIAADFDRAVDEIVAKRDSGAV